MFIISGSTHQRLGVALAQETGAEFCGVVNKAYPDGERYVRILRQVSGRDVVVIQNTFPDQKTTRVLALFSSLSTGPEPRSRPEDQRVTPRAICLQCASALVSLCRARVR